MPNSKQQKWDVKMTFYLSENETICQNETLEDFCGFAWLKKGKDYKAGKYGHKIHKICTDIYFWQMFDIPKKEKKYVF